MPSGWEWAIVLAIIVLIFGVGKLPELGRGLGQSIREFRASLSGEDKEEKKGMAQEEEEGEESAT